MDGWIDSFWDLWQTCTRLVVTATQEQSWSVPIVLIVVFSAPAEPNKHPGLHLRPDAGAATRHKTDHAGRDVGRRN